MEFICSITFSVGSGSSVLKNKLTIGFKIAVITEPPGTNSFIAANPPSTTPLTIALSVSSSVIIKGINRNSHIFLIFLYIIFFVFFYFINLSIDPNIF